LYCIINYTTTPFFFVVCMMIVIVAYNYPLLLVSGIGGELRVLVN